LHKRNLCDLIRLNTSPYLFINPNLESLEMINSKNEQIKNPVNDNTENLNLSSSKKRYSQICSNKNGNPGSSNRKESSQRQKEMTMKNSASKSKFFQSPNKFQLYPENEMINKLSEENKSLNLRLTGSQRTIKCLQENINERDQIIKELRNDLKSCLNHLEQISLSKSSNKSTYTLELILRQKELEYLRENNEKANIINDLNYKIEDSQQKIREVCQRLEEKTIEMEKILNNDLEIQKLKEDNQMY